VATDRLQIRLDAVDNTKRAFGSLKSSIFNLRNALAGIGIGVFVRSLVKTGSEVENLQQRFKFLFGSVSEGNKAFNTLINFAAKVPFSLEEISAASGNLAVVSKDAEDLNKILKITGNVAAVTGLDFQTTASQIQRSFAGGIAAADVFREKGVRALLGFEAGATISAEETIKRFEEVFGKNGRFSNASDELATTFTGVLSMLGDKIFKFKKDVDDADFFAAFKAQFRVLNDFLEDNETQIQQLAQQLGRALANAVRATADAILFVKDNLEIFINVIRIFIGLAFAKIVLALAGKFVILAGNIKLATLAMIKFNAATRRNLLLFAGAVVLGNLDKVSKGLKALGRTLGITGNDFDDFFDDADAPMPLRNIEEANKKLTMMQQILTKVKEAFNQAFGKSTKDRLKEFGGIVKKAFEGVTKSIGDAVAQTIVFGKSFKDTLRAALQQVLAQFISGLVTMGIQIILNTQLIRKFGSAIAGAMGGGKSGGLDIGTIFNIGKKALGFAEGGSIKAGQPAIVGERGRELFIPQTSGTIVPNEQMGMGGANINFTIVANDTRDFDKLLIERRSTITNLINQALNQQGRVGLV
jgi:hypothetical protein